MFHHHCMQAYYHIYVDFYFSRSSCVRTEGPMKKIMVGPLISWVSIRVLMLRGPVWMWWKRNWRILFSHVWLVFRLGKVETSVLISHCCTVSSTSNIGYSLAALIFSFKHQTWKWMGFFHLQISHRLCYLVENTRFNFLPHPNAWQSKDIHMYCAMWADDGCVTLLMKGLRLNSKRNVVTWDAYDS